jgi:hypothetical protein
MELEHHPRRAWFGCLYRGPGRLSNHVGKPAFCEAHSSRYGASALSRSLSVP